MAKLAVRVVRTKYWRPGENWLGRIIENVEGIITDGDFLIVSEKAISTASGNVIDESTVEAGLSAELIARFWMRIIWGHFLAVLCHFPVKFIQRLRQYPVGSGRRHKQLALARGGLLQALMFGSEGGIDGSNLPYSYVCLPLRNPDTIAQQIHDGIRLRLGKNICVIIADTDKTFSFFNFHFTPRQNSYGGIHAFGGFATYVFGRMLCLKRRATPLSVVGCRMPVEQALRMAEVANVIRGSGAGRNVWEMAERFDVGLTEVTWEMLERVKHKPIVIARTKR